MDRDIEAVTQPAAGEVPLVQTLAKSDLPFSGPQIMVLHGMGDGHNVSKAARLAGVHRTTVHVWRKENADYEAAFQEWKRQGREDGRAGVISLVDLALRTVKKDMLKGGVKTALTILESVGALDRDADGSTTAEEISDERMLDAEQNKIRRDERREKLVERHLKTAVARSERQRAVAPAIAHAPVPANAAPSPEPGNLTEKNDNEDDEEEEKNKERYVAAVRKIVLGQDPDDEDDPSVTTVAGAPKPIAPDNAEEDPAEAGDEVYDPEPNGLDARSA